MAQSRNALVALCYIANVKREIVHDNLAILTSFGLGERWKVPFETPCFLFVSLARSCSCSQSICISGGRAVRTVHLCCAPKVGQLQCCRYRTNTTKRERERERERLRASH